MPPWNVQRGILQLLAQSLSILVLLDENLNKTIRTPYVSESGFQYIVTNLIIKLYLTNKVYDPKRKTNETLGTIRRSNR